MALSNSELALIRYELGYNLLDVGAEPYIGVAAVFEQVIQPYLRAGVSTTSSTSVTAATTPTPVALTLADATSFTAGERVTVDVDARQEVATIQSVSGSAITVLLVGVHSGTYQVSLESTGEGIIRGILNKLRAIASMGAGSGKDMMSAAASTTGIKKVDEIEFFGGGTGMMSSGMTKLEETKLLREYWRDELAAALGIVRINGTGGGSSMSVY